MGREYFVHKSSVVRRIWGQSDTILFIFAGAAAEFALNKAVDWLFFTGKIPKDPLGRLFSTVAYARAILFSEKQAAIRAIDAMSSIHSQVEARRGQHIPAWAYRDVLYMLIDYSVRAYELLERKLTPTEKNEVFDVFVRLGQRMNIKDLPETYELFQQERISHLQSHLQRSGYTHNLFMQYKKHLGGFRYFILLESQMLVVPAAARELLGFRKFSLFHPLIIFYKGMRKLGMDWMIKELILPAKYKDSVNALNDAPAAFEPLSITHTNNATHDSAIVGRFDARVNAN